MKKSPQATDSPASPPGENRREFDNMNVPTLKVSNKISENVAHFQRATDFHLEPFPAILAEL